MLPGFLLITCPIHLHCLSILMVPMVSWSQWARRCWLKMASGQNICRILLTKVSWFGRWTVCLGRFQSSFSILSCTVGWKVDNSSTESLSLVLVLYWANMPRCMHGFLLHVLHVSSCFILHVHVSCLTCIIPGILHVSGSL